MFSLITFLTSFSIAVIAAFYSVVGMMTIFAGAPYAVGIMIFLLEASKLLIASILYKNWQILPFLMRIYFVLALIILMIITSMGIFGFLSKSYIQHKQQIIPIESKIGEIEAEIRKKQNEIVFYERQLELLDSVVNSYQDQGYIRRSSEVVEQQREERRAISDRISSVRNEIVDIELRKNDVREKIREAELEIGPLRYIAELVYGDSANERVDDAAKILIIVIVLVFDPLAVFLVVAGNIQIERNGGLVLGNKLLTSKKKKPNVQPRKSSKNVIKDLIEDKEMSSGKPLKVKLF